LELNQAWKWYGDRLPVYGGVGQVGGAFIYQSHPQVLINEANPGVFSDQAHLASSLTTGLSFAAGNQVLNGALLFYAEAGEFNFSFENVGFRTQTQPSDLIGIGLYIRNIQPGQGVGNDAVDGHFTKLFFSTGDGVSGPGGDGSSNAPLFFCNGCATMKIDEMFMSGRGMFYRGDGGQSSISALRINSQYGQGSIAPFLTVSAITGNIQLANVVLDSVNHPVVVTLPTNGRADSPTLSMENLVSGTNNPLTSNLSLGVTGLKASTFGWPYLFNGGSSIALLNTLARDGLLNGGGFGGASFVPYNTNYINGAIESGSTYPIFVNNAPMAQPTCVINAGGTLAVNSWFFTMVPIWQNGGEGAYGYTSAACVTSSGNQSITINWTAAPGNPKSYNIYYGLGGPGSQAFCQNVPASSLSFTLSNPATCQNGSPASVPSGGPSMILPGTQGISSPVYVTNGPSGFTSTQSFPAATANRTVNWPDVSSSAAIVPVTSYLNSAYDNFNRAAPLGSNWTNQGTGLTISSNTAIGAANGQENAFWNASSFSADQYAEETLATVGANGHGVGPEVRASGSTAGTANWYSCLELGGSGILLRRGLNGVATNLVITPVTITSGDVIRIEVVGNAITCKQNGTVINTATDSNLTSGSPGMEAFSNDWTLDNWSGGNLHPIAQLDTEQDWTQPQHFISPVTIGPTNPVAGALCASCLYAGGPIATVNNVATVGPGVAAIVAKADQTAQAANIAATTLYAVPAGGAGTYRASCYVVTTQAATTSSTLPSCQFNFTDNDTNLGEVSIVSQNSTANTLGVVGAVAANIVAFPIFQVRPSTNIQYQTNGYLSTGATPMQYAIHIKLEYLGQ
jgi:hypothetical protein